MAISKVIVVVVVAGPRVILLGHSGVNNNEAVVLARFDFISFYCSTFVANEIKSPIESWRRKAKVGLGPLRTVFTFGHAQQLH